MVSVRLRERQFAARVSKQNNQYLSSHLSSQPAPCGQGTCSHMMWQLDINDIDSPAHCCTLPKDDMQLFFTKLMKLFLAASCYINPSV